jgi:TolB-like protein/DNA-binding winged helix-turn-helix (wHTH) protein/Flp pilus assembly protein TadD
VSNTTKAEADSFAKGLQVGEWRVDPTGNELRRNQESVRTEPKVIEVLVHLAHRAGRVVGREELLSTVWPGVIVSDDVLTQAIIKLRRALGDDARQPKYIETISKRGYRLIASVSDVASTQAAAPPAPAPAQHWGRRALLALAGTILVAGIAVLILTHEQGRDFGNGNRAATGDPWPIVAVLPLSNQSGGPNRDYFSDGLTEDIINALGVFSGLRVISRNSVEPFKTRPATPQTIKSELGARYIVKGSVRESEGKLRVAVELSDADRGIVLWSDRQEGEGKDIFAFQDRIVKNIVGALAIKVTRLEEQRALAKPPETLEAYDLVLRARALVVSSNRVANRQARALLAKAVELAPHYGEAYVNLAAAEIQRSLDFGWTEDPAGSAQRAEQYAQRALAIDEPGAHARAHGQLGVIYSAQGKFEEALAEADRAIEINPSDALALDMRGIALMWHGRIEEAIASMETAQRFNPAGRGAGSDFSHALAYYTATRYRESLAAADAALRRYPETSFLYAIRAAALAQLGKLEEAHAAATEVMRLEPFFHSADFGNRFSDPRYAALLQEGLHKAGL